MERTSLTKTTDILKALANPARLRILALLAPGELCVCQISGVLGFAPSTVSAHLSDLRKAGIITEEKRAKFVFYRLADDPDAAAWHRLAASALQSDPQIQADRALADSNASAASLPSEGNSHE